MTPRERYRRFLHFEPGVLPPNTEPGPLVPTWERWQKEGLPPEVNPYNYDGWCDAFGHDRWPLNVAWHPPRPPLFEERVLEETETTITKRLADGAIQQDMKGGHKSIPHEIRPAVTSRDEWERLKAWMQVDAPLPSPAEPAVAEVFRKARESQRLVTLQAGSLVGGVRNWVGFEHFVTLAYDDPEWLEDLLETSCRAAEWQVRLFGENRVPIDVIHFWEDICYKNGPMMNPAHFRAMVTPRYRRIADLAARHGYDRLEVDSDGNLTALIEAWHEGGVNILCPLEVQAGMDINRLQPRYHGRIVWTGGVDKSRLAHGEKAILDEVKRVEPAFRKGGYLPMLDHNIPHDVSLADYLFYLRLRREILGLGGGEIKVRAGRG